MLQTTRPLRWLLAGLLSVLPFVAAQSAQATDQPGGFERIRSAGARIEGVRPLLCIVVVSGRIEVGDAQRLRRALDNEVGPSCQPEPGGKRLRDLSRLVVIQDSPGGIVSEALQMGEMIRAEGLDTWLVGTCVSACPLIAAGGVNRFVQPAEAVPNARIGIHKPELIVPSLDAALAERHRDAAKWAIIDFLTRMGVDATLAVRMFEVRHETMEFIRERDFALWRLATSFNRPPALVALVRDPAAQAEPHAAN